MKITYNPLKDKNGKDVGALTSAPASDIIFDLVGKNIWARGQKFFGTDANVLLSQTTTANWRPVTLGYLNHATTGHTDLYKTVTLQIYTTNILLYLPSTGTLKTTILYSTGNTSIGGNLEMRKGGTSIVWNDGDYRQRITTTDDSILGTTVFVFQQSGDKGSTWNDLFTIYDTKYVQAQGFIKTGSDDNHILLGKGGDIEITKIVNKDSKDLLIPTAKAVFTSFSSLFTNLSNDNKQLSVTIGGVNKKLTLDYANISGKVASDLIIKFDAGDTENTNLFTFNGSNSKTINITPDAIGASSTSHSHIVTINDKDYTIPSLGKGNLGKYKVPQREIQDPLVSSGGSLYFIDSIVQGTNGEIAATKRQVYTFTYASDSSKGQMGLVPAPAIGYQNYVLTGSGWKSTAPVASRTLYSIYFKDISGNNVSFNGSANLDLTTGIRYSATSGNADTLDNIHANGLLTNFSGGGISSKDNTITLLNHSISVGGTTKVSGSSTTTIINSSLVKVINADKGIEITTTINGILAKGSISNIDVDTLDGFHANTLFTNFNNSDTGWTASTINATIGGIEKKFIVNYSSYANNARYGYFSDNSTARVMVATGTGWNQNFYRSSATVGTLAIPTFLSEGTITPINPENLFSSFSGGTVTSSGNTLTQTNHSITIATLNRTSGLSTCKIINSNNLGISSNVNTITISGQVNGIAATANSSLSAKIINSTTLGISSSGNTLAIKGSINGVSSTADTSLTTSIILSNKLGISSSNNIMSIKGSVNGIVAQGDTYLSANIINSLSITYTNATNGINTKLTINGKDSSQYLIGKATTSTFGVVKVGTLGTVSNRTYDVGIDSNGKLQVNIPWTDTIPGNGKLILNSGGQKVNDTFSANSSTDYVYNIPLATSNSTSTIFGVVKGHADGTTNSGNWARCKITGGEVYYYDRASTTPGSGTFTLYANSTSLVIGNTFNADSSSGISYTIPSANGTNYGLIKGESTGSTSTGDWVKCKVVSGIVYYYGRSSSTPNNGTLTLNIGGSSYTGNGTFSANDSNNRTYNVPLATTSLYGVAKVGSPGSTSNRNYDVGINSSGKLYVNIPWSDTNTTYSAGNCLSLSNTTFNHATSGVTSGSYGPSTNSSPTHSGTFTVPYISVNSYGHITSISNKTITLPSDNNTTYTAGTDLTLSGTQFNHSNSGVTATSYGPSSDANPTHSGTFKVPYFTVNARGHITSASTKTITLPSAGNSTDEKVKQNSSTSQHALLSSSVSTSGSTGEAYYDSNVYSKSSCLYASHFYETSDIRKKNIINYLNISCNKIANLPIFNFIWKENSEKRLLSGTSALSVLKILPNLVSGDEILTLDYGILGTIAGITACRELVNQKSELEQLKERVKELEEKLSKYDNK